ncbi:hypothetical protein ACOSP7_022469 [Xanthoceras sorbifolium]
MGRPLFRVFWILLLLLLIHGFSGFGSSRADDGSLALTRPAGRSLLSLPQPVTRIGAALDGTISLIDGNGTKIWTIATGSPIYSKHQAPTHRDNDNENASEPNHGFSIECGDDWGLYVIDRLGRRMKLEWTIEDFIKRTPYISEEGAVTLGSKITTVYVVEAKTGKLIQTYKSPDSLTAPHSYEEENALHKYDTVDKEHLKSGLRNAAELQSKDLHLLFITRTDYILKSFHPHSPETSWSMRVAEIGYVFLCQEVENPFITATMNTSYEPGPEIGSDFVMPFACQSKGVIQRFRKHDDSDSSARAHHDGLRLPLPSSDLTLPSWPKVDKTLDNHGETTIPAAPNPDPILPLQSEADKLSKLYHSDDSEAALTLAALETEVSGIVDTYDVRMPYNDVPIIFEWSTALTLFLSVAIIMGFAIYYCALVAKGQSNRHLGDSNFRTAAAKRKKVRKSGKSTGSAEKNDNRILSENDDGHALSDDSDKLFTDLNGLVDGGTDGRRVGKLLVSNTEIAKGSNGTIVLEGIYEGRPVAVKRLVRTHHDVAFKEIQNLIASDRHPNIVRWYGVENDRDFVYLSLERCTCSLDDLIQTYSDSSHNSSFDEGQTAKARSEYKLWLDSVKGIMQDLNLWKANGHPSTLLLKLMRDVVSGLVHLHELGIVHRDLKPQNVLIIRERSLCAKLSDMGISKRLLADMSSLGHHATGSGSSGWQAPEQLLHGRQTRAVDLFSLGCVLYFCITGGRHPFGDRLERDINIAKNQMNLFLVECIPEAKDLISHLLNPDPQLRPSAFEVLHHPLFWSSETRLSFLRDTSDRVELADRETNSALLKALENTASVALGTKWNEKMEPKFITNIGHYRRYRFDSVRDLLRVMRNKLNHYRELPKDIQELVGPVPEGFDGYFASRFPRLLIEVYKVVCRYCREEECFQKYFKSDIL